MTRGSSVVSAQEEKNLKRFWAFLKGYLDKIFAAVSTVTAAIWGTQLPKSVDEASFWDRVWAMPSFGWWMFSIMLMASILSVLSLIFFQRPNYIELAEQAENSAIKATVIEDSLRKILHRLSQECSAFGNGYRVTMYYYLDGGFIPIARYSMSPEYRQLERGAFLNKKGVLGMAWEFGQYSTGDFPEDRAEWERKNCERFGFSEERVKNFLMHSRSWAAIRLDNEEGSTGVVLFESLAPRGVNSPTIEKAKDSSLHKILSSLVSIGAVFTPQSEHHRKLNGSSNVDQSAYQARPLVTSGTVSWRTPKGRAE